MKLWNYCKKNWKNDQKGRNKDEKERLEYEKWKSLKVWIDSMQVNTSLEKEEIRMEKEEG